MSIKTITQTMETLISIANNQTYTEIENFCSNIPELTSSGYLTKMIKYVKMCIDDDKQNGEMLQILTIELTELNSQNLLKFIELMIILCIYTIMIIFGSCGSLLIIYVVIKQSKMRTPRNLFVVNLAISDLTLCLFTQPFNLLRILYWHYDWILGQIMCKIVAMGQAANIFVSTISIIAIALDRLQVIVYPTRKKVQNSGALIIIIGSWLFAIIMASPMLIFTSVSVDTIKPNGQVCSANTIQSEWLQKAKFIYGLLTIIFQYCLPIILVSYAYIRICLRIRQRKFRDKRIHLISKIPNYPSEFITLQQNSFKDLQLSHDNNTNNNNNNSNNNNNNNNFTINQINSHEDINNLIILHNHKSIHNHNKCTENANIENRENEDDDGDNVIDLNNQISSMKFNTPILINDNEYHQNFHDKTVLSNVNWNNVKLHFFKSFKQNLPSQFQTISSASNNRIKLWKKRQTRTNTLLVSITLIFILAWFPLHLFNLLMDQRESDIISNKLIDNLNLMNSLYRNDFNLSHLNDNEKIVENKNKNFTINSADHSHQFDNMLHNDSSIHFSQTDSHKYGIGRKITLINSFCLLCVLISACANPFLYGWLNENFHREFTQMFPLCLQTKPKPNSPLINTDANVCIVST